MGVRQLNSCNWGSPLCTAVRSLSKGSRTTCHGFGLMTAGWSCHAVHAATVTWLVFKCSCPGLLWFASKHRCSRVQLVSMSSLGCMSIMFCHDFWWTPLGSLEVCAKFRSVCSALQAVRHVGTVCSPPTLNFQRTIFTSTLMLKHSTVAIAHKTSRQFVHNQALPREEVPVQQHVHGYNAHRDTMVRQRCHHSVRMLTLSRIF